MKRPDQLRTFLLISSFSFLFTCFLLLAWCQTLWGLEKSKPFEFQGQLANKTIIKGIDLLYDEQFDEAEILFHNVITDFPEKPEGYFYLAMVTWSRLAAGFWSPDTLGEYRERIDWTIQVAKSRIKHNVADSYDYLYLGGALGFRGRLELMKGKWLSSYFLA
ncbi:MAG: hypothetical protein JRJ69_05270, partial [Deltaproteobacteria bacterium]|nr:hypothetical protein [Deltaproteobacteria bacterium]MBW1736968.1 hypothetical protein [Deltaproteobacteria bacterium]MBW2113352.1 hypothetical protein [Deltaproteobacteria bacterium]MBW2358547.1 hypothetical protein [Deltaproteobacteria bacterium]